jgi:hypothetical protein
MVFRLIFILFAIPLWLKPLVAQGEVQPLSWKTEVFGTDCAETQSSPEDGSERDFVQYKCKSKYGPAMWQLFQEGTRMSVGFGSHPNVSLRYVNAQRGVWPITWGGVEIGGRFEAEFAIARFTFPEEIPQRQVLAIFAILKDGTSCVVRIVEPQSNQNQKAQEIAVSASSKPQCELKSFILE